MNKEEQKANEIIKKLCSNGWQAYVAGGAARDLLRGEVPEDYDVVTNAPYDEIRKLFRERKLSIVGISFKVCIIEGIEVATYRKDARFDPKDSDYGEEAETVNEDLAHRDLTINAMAYCPYNGEIVDNYGGMDDLKNGIIRFTGNPVDRIKEDPCRIIRACRFKAKIKGKFDSETLKEIRKNKHLVKELVAPERIRMEILKAMKCSEPGLFFDSLIEAGLLENMFPDFSLCVELDGGKYHNESVYEHSKIVGGSLPAGKPLLRLAGYFHDIGKPVAAENKNGNISFIGHENIGADLIEKILLEYKFSLKETAYVKSLVNLHMRNIDENTKAKTVRKALKAFRDSCTSWKDWLQLKIADRKGNLTKKNYSRDEIKAVVLKIHKVLHPAIGSPALSISDLAISGSDVIKEIKINPGPEVGKILKQTLEYVLDHPEKNNIEDLTCFIKNIS